MKVAVARADAFEEGRARVVQVGKVDVAVFLAGSRFYAIKDACPHQGHSLGTGRVVDGVLSCPGHNWRFEIATGRCLKGDPEITLRTFEVVRDGDEIAVVA